MEEQEIILNCKACSYNWAYKGKKQNLKSKNREYTSCPKCRANVRIK